MAAFASFWFFVGLVCYGLFFHVINRRLKWYVPSFTNLELSKQLSTNLSVVTSASTQLASAYAQLYEPAKQLTQTVTEIELSRELIVDVLKAQATQQLQAIHPDVIDRIIRDVSPTVTRQLIQRLQPAVNLASEYVLLHSIEEVEFDVKVIPSQYHAHELRQAIKRALEYRQRKSVTCVDGKSSMDHFLDVSRNDQEFELFLGRVGNELLNLRMEGTVALRRKPEMQRDLGTIPITG